MKTNVKKFLGRENKYREEINRVQKERKEKKKEAKKQKEVEKRKDGQDKPNENLSDEKWRSRARVDEQKTTEDGKELNKAIVDGRERFQAARSAAGKRCTLQKQRQLEITCYGLLMRFSCCIFFTVSCSSYSFLREKKKLCFIRKISLLLRSWVS